MRGDRAGLDAWSLAVDLGARGRYLPAWHRLESMADLGDMASVAESTLGSHYRQIGMLDLAQRHDERAAERAVTDLAAVDAWIGLAANAIATGVAAPAAARLDRAEQLLTRAQNRETNTGPTVAGPTVAVPTVAGPTVAGLSDNGPMRAAAGDVLLQSWRGFVRCAWVRSELALLNQQPEIAIDHARTAIAYSAPHSSRHLLKSEAILAASLVAAGRAVAAAEICQRIGLVIRQAGWASLMWPVALIAVAASEADPDVEVPRGLIGQGAWATRVIEAHLPDSLPGQGALRWRERPDIVHLRTLAAY